MCSKILSVELGDYDPAIHVGNYVTEMRLLLRQTDTIEARIQVRFISTPNYAHNAQPNG